jgi:hypothetical protein
LIVEGGLNDQLRYQLSLASLVGRDAQGFTRISKRFAQNSSRGGLEGPTS